MELMETALGQAAGSVFARTQRMLVYVSIATLARVRDAGSLLLSPRTK
jgi:hypothetical protein